MLYRVWFPLNHQMTAFTYWAPNDLVAAIRAKTVWQSYATELGGGLIYHVQKLTGESRGRNTD